MRSRHARGQETACVTALQTGLHRLGGDFPVQLCAMCHGQGEYLQRYIEGRFLGQCEICGGYGVIYRHGTVVPVSLYHQILVAGGFNAMPDARSHAWPWRPRQPARLG